MVESVRIFDAISLDAAKRWRFAPLPEGSVAGTTPFPFRLSLGWRSDRTTSSAHARLENGHKRPLSEQALKRPRDDEAEHDEVGADAERDREREDLRSIGSVSEIVQHDDGSDRIITLDRPTC